MAINEANAMLMGGEKIPSATFNKKGTRHEGEVVAATTQQQTDPKTREPLFWDNGDPKMQVVVTIQTDERGDEDGEDYDDEIVDDGRRKLYLKYKSLKAVQDAVRDAHKEANSDPKLGIEIGGWLGVEFVSQGKAAKRGLSGVKEYEAWYELPDETAAANKVLNADDPDDDDDDDGDTEPEPPKASKSKAKASAEKAPARGRGRRSEANDDDGYTDPADDADGDSAPPRGRGRAATSGAASSGRGRGRRS